MYHADHNPYKNTLHLEHPAGNIRVLPYPHTGILHISVTVGCIQVPVETTNVRIRFFPSYAEAVWVVRFTSIHRSPFPTPGGSCGELDAAGGGGGGAVSVGSGVKVAVGVDVSVGVLVGVAVSVGVGVGV